ncbi:MAG: MarC family protein [Rhizobiaceae bacterium]|nr:MarC family protein [Rhizobiaceae bacterium]MBL4732350.1 MarC family protein [Rhizobiaceae bacterium]
MPTIDAMLNTFATLFVTIDPAGLLPIFLAVTAGMKASERRSVAVNSIIIAFVLLIIFALAGSTILDTLGITIHAFKIAGGLMLFYIAFEMIFEKRQARHEKSSQTALTKDDISNIAVFPMAIPMIAGPGAISATILLAENFGETWSGFGILVLLIASVMALLLATFLLADYIDKAIGTTGRNILSRLMGVLLAALSVQFVADGITALASAA